MMGFPGSSMGKESTCNAGDTGGMGSIPGSEEEGMATHSGILDWRISWAEEPGRLQSIGLQRVERDWSDWAHTQTNDGWGIFSYIWHIWGVL